MIDSQKLQEMRQRAKEARPAIHVLSWYGHDRLFGEMSEEQAELAPAVASARDVPALLDEMERLSPAAYTYGLEACRERECGHVDWETADPDATCPEVEERVATLNDVKRAEYLDELAQQLRVTAEAFQRGEEDAAGRSLAQLVLAGIEGTYDRIKEWESTGEESTW